MRRRFGGLISYRCQEKGLFERAVATILRRSGIEDGNTIVEMALSSIVLLAMFFAVFRFTLASYTYHYVSEAAREGSRFAIVRGSESCGNTPNLTNCNASATTIGNYVKSLGYPGINSTANMTVTTTWLRATTTSGGTNTTTTWAACTAGTCNAPGNMVHVVVTYAFPLSIPFVPQRTISISSTSQMVVQQ